jgi:hypothetical protein
MKTLAPTVSPLLEMNRISAPYGLSLTEPQARSLAESRASFLKGSGRVEFGCGIYGILIQAFCSSPYLERESYPETLDNLQESFECFKEEAEELGDPISSDELIDAMRKVFDGLAGGSIDKLTDLSFTKLTQAVDANENDFEPGLPEKEPLPIRRSEEGWLDAVESEGWEGEAWEDGNDWK